jgi:putative acetyltransferase
MEIAMEIRLFHPQDADRIAQLFHDTVRQVNIKDYKTSQVKAWAPDNLHSRNWAKSCSQKYTYVAEDGEIILGFGELEFNGHIDCFYCHKDYQRCGIGRKIYEAIEAKAIELGLNLLFTEASITAKPFFEKMGFFSLEQQQVICRGETFINYSMQKDLTIC